MSEVVKIDKKITSFKVKKEEPNTNSEDSIVKIEEPKGLTEKIARETTLSGRTYKIKPTNLPHSFYITINNQEVEGILHPFEIFINSKSVEHFEYFSTITRLISAVFRKGGDINFIVAELAAIYSPLGGYWGKDRVTGKGRYYNSIMNEIGEVIKEHIDYISNFKIENPVLDSVSKIETTEEDDYPENATICSVCKHKAVVTLDKCPTCLNCGDSKCG